MVKRSRRDSHSSLEDSDIPVEADRHMSASPEGSQHSTKYIQLESSVNPASDAKVMQCLLPPHPALSFSSFADYDVHYQNYHVNRCSECRKNFPSDHYLSLHIAENHDPLNEARKERGEKIYGCFVEDCDRKCSTPQKRRLHVIDKHQFPRMYDFFIVNDGIDRRNSMLRPGPGDRRRSSAAKAPLNGHQLKNEGDQKVQSTASQQEAGNEEQDASNSRVNRGDDSAIRENSQGTTTETDAVDSITTSMSALKLVPASVRFGRPKGRGGLARR